MFYALQEVIYLGCSISIINKIFKTEFSEHQHHKQILTVAIVVFYQIRIIANIGLCVFLIDKILHVKCPEYRLHKRILAITAVNGYGDRNQKEVYNSLTLSETNEISTTQNCLNLINDVLCSPNHHLHNLTISRNVILESAKILSEGLSSPNNSSLESLNISCNRYVTNDTWKLIVEALSSGNRVTSSLRFLQLHGNGIDVLGAKLISNIFRENCAIEFLNLRDNAIGDEGITFLVQAISASNSNIKLVRLDVGRNYITETGIKAICQMLVKNNTLQHLNLETNNFSDQGCEFISEVLVKSTSLRTLNLQNNSITLSGAQCIAKALIRNGNSKLTEINLSSNKSMGEDGIEAVTKALSRNNENYSNTTLQILRLDGNLVRLQAAGAIQNMIMFNSNLVQLNLRSCFIYDEATKLIADALLARTCSLQNLNLQGNRIGVVGSRHLGKALAKNVSLKMLNLAFNSSFGLQGVLELGEGLYSNSTLKVLNLAFCFSCPHDLIDHSDGDRDLNRNGECTIVQALSKALFFPLLSKSNNDNDVIDKEVRYPIHPRYDDIIDQRVGWNPSPPDIYPPLDLLSSTNFCKTAESLNSNHGSIKAMSKCPCEKYRTSSVYGWTPYAKQKDVKKNFPLQTAVNCKLKWRNGIQKLLEANYQVMEEEDDQTGLLPFMTAAVGDNSDWESVYHLLQQNPGNMVSYVLNTKDDVYM